MAPVTPARKAYRQLKSMISSLKPVKPSQVATMLEHARCEMPAQIDVPGGQMAPGHQNSFLAQTHEMTVQTAEFYEWGQVAKTSVRFISVLLDCPEILPSTDLDEAHPNLAHFIAFALNRSCMPLCVHQYAVHLIWRVKCLHPEFKPRHAHGVYSLNDWSSDEGCVDSPSSGKRRRAATPMDQPTVYPEELPDLTYSTLRGLLEEALDELS
ncbi:hypothetical protein RSOL_448540, partial [Rhizoctonia solani AG-3 Rhs1AP]